MDTEKTEKTDVKSVYKKHVISKEKRTFTNSLLNSLKRPTVNRIQEGEVYCLKYQSKSYQTDKWHTLSVVYVTEVKGAVFTGINLLYLNPAVTLNILHNAEKVKTDLKQTMFYQQLLKESENFPIVCAKKTFVGKYVASSVQIKREHWGMLPLLEKGLFGNLNVNAMIEDWKKEAETFVAVKKKKKKLVSKQRFVTEDDDEEELNEEMIDEVFDKGATGSQRSLESIEEEIMEDDDI